MNTNEMKFTSVHCITLAKAMLLLRREKPNFKRPQGLMKTRTSIDDSGHIMKITYETPQGEVHAIFTMDQKGEPVLTYTKEDIVIAEAV